MVKKLLRSISVVIWLISSIAGTSFAQVQNASLTGLVSDPSGAMINGASVTIRNNATNVTYMQKTDQSGYYLFPFGVPNNDVTSGQFGQITSLAGDARVMQFALKFIF